MKPVKIAVVGLGGMGQQHLEHLQAEPLAQVVGVSDADPEKTTQTAARWNVLGSVSPGDIMDRSGCEAVIVATPHYFHPEIAIAAFKRGLHVMSEKPLAVSVSAADRMIAAARKAGSRFGVMFQSRTNTAHKALKDIITAGRIGAIHRVLHRHSIYRSQAYYAAASWRGTWGGEGGGVLMNQAPHTLDTHQWLCGMPSTVYARTRTRLHRLRVEDDVMALLEYPGGAVGFLSVSVTEVPQGEHIEIRGDRGIAVLETFGPRTFRLSVGTVEPSLSEFTANSTEMWGSPKVRWEPPVDLAAEMDHTLVIRAWLQAIRGEGEMIVSGEEGLAAVELINAMILSGHRDKTVSIPVSRKAYDSLLKKLVAEEKAAMKEKS